MARSVTRIVGYCDFLFEDWRNFRIYENALNGLQLEEFWPGNEKLRQRVDFFPAADWEECAKARR